jgi:ABC-type glycerol-3-phosphate transport system permease component
LDELFLFPPRLLPRNITFDNFRDLSELMSNSWIPFTRYFFNTILITVTGTIGHVLIASMAAFPLAKYKFPGRTLIFTLVVYSLMFAPQVTATPNYIIVSWIGLVDTPMAIIFPAIASSLGLYLMKQFMEQIPMELIESAKIDGASEYRIFFQIVMPLVKPAWLTLIILLFQRLWITDGGSFIFSEELKPVSYALRQIAQGTIERAGTIAAVAFIMMIVPVTFFIFSQSRIVETFSHSGMK